MRLNLLRNSNVLEIVLVCLGAFVSILYFYFREDLYDTYYEDERITHLKRHRFKILKQESLEVFDVGPFKEDKFSLGKSDFDDDLTSPNKRVFYRKLIVKRRKKHVLYVRIVTGNLISEPKVKFRPTLKELKIKDNT